MDQSEYWQSQQNGCQDYKIHELELIHPYACQLIYRDQEISRVQEQLDKEKGKVTSERLRVATLELELNLVKQERDELNDELIIKCDENEYFVSTVKELKGQLQIAQTAKADLEGRMESLNAIVEAAKDSATAQMKVQVVHREDTWKNRCEDLTTAVAKAREQIVQIETEKEKKAAADAEELTKLRHKCRDLEDLLEEECRQKQVAVNKSNDKEAVLSAEFDAEKKRLHGLIEQKSAAEAEQYGRLEGQREFVRQLTEKIQQISQEKDELEETYRQRIEDLNIELKAGQTAQRDLAATNLEKEELKLKEKNQRILQLEEHLVLHRQRCDALENERDAAEAEKNANLSDSENQKLAYENDLAGLRGRIAVADQAVEAKKKELESMERRVEEARQSLQQERQRCCGLEMQLTKCQRDRETELATLREQNQHLDASMVHSTSHQRELEGQLQTVNEQKAAEQRLQNEKTRRLEDELGEEIEKRRQIEEKFNSIQKQHEQELSQKNIRLARKESELANKADSMSELDGRMEEQRQYVERLKSNLQDARRERDEVQRQVVSLREEFQTERKRAEALDAELKRQREEATVSRDSHERELSNERTHGEEMLRTYREASEMRMENHCRRNVELEEQLSGATERNEVLSRLVQASQIEVENVEATHRQTIQDLTAMKQLIEKKLGDMENELHAKSTWCEHLLQKNERYEADLATARNRNEGMQKELRRNREDDEKRAQKSLEMTAELDSILQVERQQRREGEERWEQRAIQKDQEIKDCMMATQKLQGELSEERQRSLDAEKSFKSAQDVWNLERQRHLDQVEQLEREVQIQGQKVAILEQEKNRFREDKSGLLVQEQKLSRKVDSYENQLQKMTPRLQSLTTQLDEKENQLQEALRLRKLLYEAEEEKKQALARKTQLQERLAMQSQELQQRRVEGDLTLRRARGALDESRKVLRDMNFAPRLSTTSDPRISELERQLASEKMKVTELAVQKENRDYKLKTLTESYGRERDRCEELSKQLFSDERRRIDVHEELGAVKAQLATRDRKVDIMRERMAMLAEELMTRTNDYNLQAARMQGQLEESRFLANKVATPRKWTHTSLTSLSSEARASPMSKSVVPPLKLERYRED